jgi:hypothetical protein
MSPSAAAVPECGGIVDNCQCGASNFCICCSSSTYGTNQGNCVWWACTANQCAGTDIAFADMGGPFGACVPDGVADANDRFHALNCVSNQSAKTIHEEPMATISPNPTFARAGNAGSVAHKVPTTPVIVSAARSSAT